MTARQRRRLAAVGAGVILALLFIVVFELLEHALLTVLSP